MSENKGEKMDKNIFIRRDNCANAMKLLSDFPVLIVFDTETTGLSIQSDIIQLSAIKITPTARSYYAPTAKIESLNVYMQPACRVPSQAELDQRQAMFTSGQLTDRDKNAFDVNLISAEVLNEKGVTPMVGLNTISEFFTPDAVYSGYNVAFDIKMLNAMYMKTFGTMFQPEKVIDVMKMAMECVDRKDLAEQSFKQVSVAELYGAKTIGQLHSADADTYITLQLLFMIGSDYSRNYKFLDDPAVQSTKPKMDITFMENKKYSKISNMVMISVVVLLNDKIVTGAIHYDRYNKRYIEDSPGYLIPSCNMLAFAEDADNLSGGNISKFKKWKGE